MTFSYCGMLLLLFLWKVLNKFLNVPLLPSFGSLHFLAYGLKPNPASFHRKSHFIF